MTPPNLYDRVAARCASAMDLPLSAAAIQDVERFLKEERRACAYDRAGVPIAGAVTDVVVVKAAEPTVVVLERGPQ